MMDLVRILGVVVICSVAVKAAPIVPSEITVKEGDNATFASGLDDTMHVVLTNDANKVLLNFDKGKDMTAEKRIDVCIKDGAIIIPHVQRNYSKYYELRIYNSDGQWTPYPIRLNVTARPPPDSDDPSLKTTSLPINEEQTQRSRLGLYISLGLIGLVVVVLVCLYLKKRKHSSSNTHRVQAAQDSKGELTCCVDVTGADSSGSTSRSDSLVEQEKDEEKLMTPKHP